MRILQKKNIVFIAMLSALLMASCTSYKKVPYLQNSAEFVNMEQATRIYEPKIQPYDLLNIIITNPENVSSSMAYNLTTPSDFSRTPVLTSQPTLQNYLVDASGCVVIPSVGKVNIAGLTVLEAENFIFKKVEGAFSSEPVVTVRFADFKVSVLGEVANPGTFTVKNGKVNVLQALALASDLTIYGERSSVKVIRENEAGKKEIAVLDLNDASILNSPYYNLQQNDIVYVTPNKAKAQNSDVGTSTSLWFSGTSIFISLISLLYNILK